MPDPTITRTFAMHLNYGGGRHGYGYTLKNSQGEEIGSQLISSDRGRRTEVLTLSATGQEFTERSAFFDAYQRHLNGEDACPTQPNKR